MKEYFQIKNNYKTKFEENLELTNNFDDLLFMEKPSKKFWKLKKDNNFLLYKLLINKYDFITYETLNNFYKNNDKLNIDVVTINNNITNIAGISIHPVVKGFNTNNLLLNTIYPGGLKYFTVALNPYLNTLVNKTICIIKIIGPWEINDKDELELYFHEELFFKIKNRIKTIFTYTTVNNKKEYKKVINDNGFEYIIVNKLDDDKIGKFIKDCDVVIIDKISILNKYKCVDDSTVMTHTLFLVNQYLLSGKKNSDLIFLYTTPHILPHYQLYYYLYRNFITLTYYKSILSEFRDGIFIFKSFEKLEDKLVEQIVEKYKKIDMSFGHNLYINTDETWCTQQSKIPDVNISILISSLYHNNFSHKFNTFMEKIKNHKKHIVKINIKKIEYLQKYILFKDNFNYKKIKTFVLFNIDECIQLLESHKIGINELYKNNTIFNSVKLLKTFFPNINDNILTKIQFSRDSIYSISSYDIAEETSMLIKTNFKNIKNIIDGTANIGGNSFNFSKHFDKVISNELSQSTYNNLKNNISILKLNNVECYNNDIIELLNNKIFLNKINYNKTDWCLYLDPPWTGVYYKLDKNIDLYFGNVNVCDFIKNTNINYICMKVPKNFNFSYLFELFNDIKIFKVVYCYIILIEKNK
jgi:hypothetical protein